MNNESEVHSGLKLIAKSSVIIFIGLILSKFFTYIYRIIVARIYGPEVYGLFSLAIMVLGFFIAFFSFGFSDGLLRFISWYRGKNEINKIKYLYKLSSIITLFSGIIAAVLLYFLSETISIKIFHDENLIIFLKAFSFIIPLYLFANIFLSVLQAFEKITWHTFILNVLQNLIKIIALFLFIFLGFETNAVIFSFFLSIVVMFFVSYIVCKKITKEIFGKNNLDKKQKRKVWGEFFAYSWPLLFSGIIATILLWVDSFSIGYFKTAFEVGLYNAAIPLILLLRFAPEIFLKLFFPLITRELSRGRKNVVNELSKQVAKWILVINIPLFLIMIIFPEAIIQILFGQEYLAAASSVRILAIGAFAINSAFISNNLLYIIGKSKLLLFDLVILSIVDLLLNLIFVPKYGIEGAALTTTISNFALALILFFQAKHYTSIIPIKKNMIKIFIVSIIPALIVYLIKLKIPSSIASFFLLGFFLVLLYGILIFITNSLDRNDFMILKGLKRRILN